MRNYNLAAEYIKGVFDGHINALGIVGSNGVGKTILIEEHARESRLIKEQKGGYVFLNGYITCPALVDILERYSTFNKSELRLKTIIIFNDCSILHSNKFSDQAFMKSLLETSESGFATYRTSGGRCVQIDISCFSFIFTGNATVVNQSPHLRAIFDRLLTIELIPSIAEMIDLTYRLLIYSEQSQSKKNDKEFVMAQIIERLVLTGSQNYSLRTFNKIMSIHNLNPNILQDAIACEFKTSERYDQFKEIYVDSTYKTDIERAYQFEMLTGLKRRSYFNYKRRYLSTMSIKKARVVKKVQKRTPARSNQLTLDL